MSHEAVWSDEDVKAFISEQINYYGFEVTAEETKQSTSLWKQWIWLEKHGFDFAYQSLEAQIFAFRLNEERSGALPGEDRLLLVQIRNAMRAILAMEKLTEAEEKQLLASVPLSNWTHWVSVRRPYGPGDIEPRPDTDLSDVISFAWRFLTSDRPEYVRILREVAQYSDTNPESFCDHVTVNGSYYLYLGRHMRRSMVALVSAYYIKKTFDMFFQPGNLRLADYVSERFIDYIVAKLEI